MTKINGFIEMPSDKVEALCNAKLLKIAEWRENKKKEMVEKFIRQEMEQNLFQRIFRIHPKRLSFSEAIEKMDRNARNTFLGMSVDQTVSIWYEALEKDVKELLKASRLCTAVLVNTKLASMLE